jgi:4-hydroxybenzoate polyprenyltransferase
MRVIVSKKKTMAKKILILFGVASLVVLITGAVLFNPICLGAGTAGLFLICGMAVGLKKRQPTYMV